MGLSAYESDPNQNFVATHLVLQSHSKTVFQNSIFWNAALLLYIKYIPRVPCPNLTCIPSPWVQPVVPSRGASGNSRRPSTRVPAKSMWPRRRARPDVAGWPSWPLNIIDYTLAYDTSRAINIGYNASTIWAESMWPRRRAWPDVAGWPSWPLNIIDFPLAYDTSRVINIGYNRNEKNPDS